jgi:hypothetical protein
MPTAPLPRASVLIPTHEHAETIPFAVASVQAQGIDDIEILIVGDGVAGALRDTIERLRADDPRIRYFEFPKGPRNGEIHRHSVLLQAKGRIICYQADDDLWMPGHLQTMEAALEDADFVGAMHINVETDGQARGYLFDLERPEFSAPWLAWQQNDIHRLSSRAMDGFGLAFCAHQRDAYLRLPEGWATTETPGRQTDQTMWKKFVREPWCRVKSLHWPVSLHFSAPARRGWTPQQRADELARWSDTLADPDRLARLRCDIMTSLVRDLFVDSVGGVAARDLLERERCAHRLAATQRDMLLGSRTWRWTRPLRSTVHSIREFAARMGERAGRG